MSTLTDEATKVIRDCVSVIHAPMPLSNDQAIALLAGAKTKLKDLGWVQNRSMDNHGQVCAGHAMALTWQEITRMDKITATRMQIAEYEFQFQQGLSILLTAATERTQRSWGSVPEWNDLPSRTKDEILETFDYALKGLGAPI